MFYFNTHLYNKNHSYLIYARTLTKDISCTYVFNLFFNLYHLANYYNGKTN